MIAGVFLMYSLSFYTQTLLEISQGIERSHIALDEVSSRYTESLHNRDIIEQYYGGRSFAKAKLIAFLLEEDPSALNEPTEKIHSVYDEAGNLQHLTDDEGNPLRAVASSTRLQALADANDIDAIYVFDTDGHTIATNTPNWFFTVSHDETAQSYPFLDVLAGRKDSFVQERMVNDLGEETQLIGVTFHYYTSLDEDGNTVYVSHKDYQYPEEGAAPVTMHTSMVQIALDNEVAARLMASTDVDAILSTHMLSDGFIVLFDSGEGHRCLYSPNAASIGITADELGVSPKAFSGDDYYGFANINGVQYFSCFRYMDGYFIGTALPRADMYQARLTISLLTALTCFVMILLLSLVVTLTTREEELMYATMSEDQAKNRLNSAIFNIILPSGRTAATTKAAARWDNRHIPWRNRSPEQKLATMISVVLGILILFAMLSCLGANRFFSQDSVIHYILSGRWDRGLNVFALSASALALVGVGIIVTIFRLPVRIMTSLLGTRSETIGHLLLSVVKYGGAIGAIFYCLFLLGIESGNLLASAGILSLVIGLGAQSLIKDILAGIFIVFEGEFRVGDIVTISGYRGTVLDIGLRTTKIMAPDGNVKIYNNSEISGVLNMTQEASVATCTISIEYGQDIDYVEAVLERELPKLKEMNPLILDGPTYLGVSNLGESGVDLLVIGRCFEGDVKGVARFLNREVLKIFYRNDINVPFPNVTVSQLDTSVRKTMEDFVPDPDDTDVADQTEEES